MPELDPSAELKKLRASLPGDVSQDEMARRLGLVVRTYVRYESGETKTIPSTGMDAARKLSGER